MSPEELKAIADDIIATLPNIAPTEAQEILVRAAADAIAGACGELRFRLLMNCGLFIEDQMKSHPELDKDSLMRLVSHDLFFTGMFLARSVKRHEGTDLVPARMALVVYGLASEMLKLGWEQRLDDEVRSDGGSLRDLLQEVAKEQAVASHIDIVFDGPPDNPAPHFVEVEDASGKSTRFGEWIERSDGYWALRIPVEKGGHL